MRVLFVSPYYPSARNPHHTPFIKRLFEQLQTMVDARLCIVSVNRNIFGLIYSWLKVLVAIYKHKPDIVQVNWGYTIAVIPPTHSKLITTFRGSDVLGVWQNGKKQILFSAMARALSKLATMRSSFIVGVSKEILADNVFKMKPDKLRLIPSGLDFNIINSSKASTLRKTIGMANDDIIILFVGDPLNSRKRYKLVDKIIKTTKFKQTVKLISIYGKQPSEVFSYMKIADFLIQASIQEGSPNIVKEALACNLRIISTPVGDTPLRIGNLEGCYLSLDFSEEELKRTICRAVEEFDRNVSFDYGSIVNHLSVENEAKEYLKIYNDLIRK